MLKITVAAVVLMAAGLFPVLQGWKRTLCSERRAVRQVLAHHPKIQLMNLVVLDPEETARQRRYLDPENAVSSSRGLRLEVRFHGDDIPRLTALRRELKAHPLLANRFDRAEMGGCGWRVADPSEDPAFVVLDLFLLPRGK